MVDILHMVEIFESTDKVFDAITQEKGIQSWWSEDTQAEPKQGADVVVGFHNKAMVFNFNITEFKENEKVVWVVKSGPPDWDNTTISWTIMQDEDKTILNFSHTGFASLEGGFPSYNFNWGLFLASLKSYVERGEGMPHMMG